VYVKFYDKLLTRSDCTCRVLKQTIFIANQVRQPVQRYLVTDTVAAAMLIARKLNRGWSSCRFCIYGTRTEHVTNRRSDAGRLLAISSKVTKNSLLSKRRGFQSKIKIEIRLRYIFTLRMQEKANV
jgi:hypothetical protein